MTLDSNTVLDKLPDGLTPNNDFLESLQGKADSKELKDFYQVGLFSYCEGDRNNQTGEETITYCSARKFQFHFDPLKVWDMNGTSIQEALGDKYDSGMNVYKKVAGWMNWAFVITLVLTASEFVIGFFAIFSRWGSLITTIVSTVSFYPSSSIMETMLTYNSSGPNRLRHRRCRNRHSHVRYPDRCLQDRPRPLQHRYIHGLADAVYPLDRCRLLHWLWLLLAHQRLLLQRKELAQEDGSREDSLYI